MLERHDVAPLMEGDPARPVLRLSVIVAHDLADGTSRARKLVLTCEQRARTRFRATLSDGSPAIVMLARGSVIRPGTVLASDDGETVAIAAASEQIYRVTAAFDRVDPTFDLLRAAYHLGNRHVPVELGHGILKLERDPVLRNLIERLGLHVEAVFESFDPEPGAYGGGHRHDTDIDGGATGEALSREAHAVALRA